MVRLELERDAGGVLHVRSFDGDAEVAHIVGGEPFDMIREAAAVVDPVLGVELGADAGQIIRRLTGSA